MTRTVLHSDATIAVMKAAGWAPEYPDCWSHQFGAAVLLLDEPEIGEPIRGGLWSSPDDGAPACTFSIPLAEIARFVEIVGTLPAVPPGVPAPLDADARVREWCLLNRARCDGDAFGQAFSDMSQVAIAAMPGRAFNVRMVETCDIYGLWL